MAISWFLSTVLTITVFKSLLSTVVFFQGAIHWAKIAGNFGLKLNGTAAQSNRKSLEKPLLGWTVSNPFSISVPRCSVRTFLLILEVVWLYRKSLEKPLFGTFHVQLWGKHLSLQLLWVVNSGFISVTRTSMWSNSPGGRVLPEILDRGVPRRVLNPNPI